MPITFEQFDIFLAAGMDQARDIAKAFVLEINLPITIGSTSSSPPLIGLCCQKEIPHQLEKLKLLLDIGAYPNIFEKYIGSPLTLALKYDRGSEFIKILLDKRANINLPDDNGETAVFTAVEYRRFDDLRVLLSLGGNLNHHTNDGSTPLTVEIRRKEPSLEVVKLLIELGADVHAANNLYWALRRWDAKALHIVETLIEHGVSVNAGYSPLALAASERRCPVSTIAMLVKAGAVVDYIDVNGMTPLLIASANGHTEAVKFLLECKASATHCDANGKSALHWCCKEGNAAIIPLLVSAGADIDLPDRPDRSEGETDGGRTPLMYAVSIT